MSIFTNVPSNYNDDKETNKLIDSKLVFLLTLADIKNDDQHLVPI